MSFFRIKESLLDIKRFTTLVFWNTPTYPALGQWSIKWSGILVPSDAPYPRREGEKKTQTVHHPPQAAIQEGDCVIYNFLEKQTIPWHFLTSQLSVLIRT